MNEEVKTSWWFWLWQAWLLVVTGTFCLFLIVGIALFNIFLPAELEPPDLTGLMMSSSYFWCLAAVASWGVCLIWSRGAALTRGLLGLVLPTLWHLSWLLFLLAAVTVGLFGPMLETSHAMG